MLDGPKWCTDGRNTANNNISSGHRCTLLVLVSNSDEANG
ncbi:hypothetical protein FOFC_12444 [Fusarium oxysporum]|nr:hypothetical protein FOFC_12444 [Fusarium oxysporum]